MAWCTGGAQGLIDQAADLGFDAYVTGEVSESTVHVARERGIHFFAAGHHATERFGVQALGEEFATHVGDDVTLIAGAELGGVALAASTAMASGKNWIIVRNSKKGYGTGKMVEGVLKEGDVVLLVEDIATTGGQVIEAAKIITDAGATVKKIVCVIDRKQGAEENVTGAGHVFESIITKDDLGIKD